MCLDLNLGRAPRRIWPSDPTPKCCSMHSFSATVRLADTNARAKASQAHDGLVCFVSRMRVGPSSMYHREEVCNLLLS